MVQEQRTQLKMNFLLGYNIKVAIYWGEWTFGGRSRVFQIALRCRGIPPLLREMPNFAGWGFFVGWWEAEVEWFRSFEPYIKLKKHSVINEHQSRNYHELSVQTVWC